MFGQVGAMHFLMFAEPAVVAKSSILLDVKPWDDETDMAKLEECVRSIQADGLVWGSCKFNGGVLKLEFMYIFIIFPSITVS